MPPKTRIYIDGYNLFYRALKDTPYLWLDVHALCKNILPQLDIVGIRYFTARVRGTFKDPQKPNRQAIYIRALETIPCLKVTLGQFRTNNVLMPLVATRKTVLVEKTEEKGSDVNLASYLLVDGYKKEYEKAVVISNDSDLLTPLRLVREELKRQVIVLNPDRQNHSSLGQWGKAQTITEAQLAASQFPSTLADRFGTITKPSNW